MLTATERKNLKKHVSEDNARLVEIFDTLGDANRCKLFRLVAKDPNLNVTEASQTLGLSVPLTSQHFKILVQAKMLFRHKKGRQVSYTINSKDPMISAILKAVRASSS